MAGLVLFVFIEATSSVARWLSVRQGHARCRVVSSPSSPGHRFAGESSSHRPVNATARKPRSADAFEIHQEAGVGSFMARFSQFKRVTMKARERRYDILLHDNSAAWPIFFITSITLGVIVLYFCIW